MRSNGDAGSTAMQNTLEVSFWLQHGIGPVDINLACSVCNSICFNHPEIFRCFQTRVMGVLFTLDALGLRPADRLVNSCRTIITPRYQISGTPALAFSAEPMCVLPTFAYAISLPYAHWRCCLSSAHCCVSGWLPCVAQHRELQGRHPHSQQLHLVQAKVRRGDTQLRCPQLEQALRGQRSKAESWGGWALLSHSQAVL